MDRELLLEIGCEELPARWLPDLTNDIGEQVARQLREFRLAPEAPVESFSTPRRLAVRVLKVPERQTDLEELVTGPSASAAFDASGQPTPAAVGFARKQGIDVAALERIETSKGAYVGIRRRQRGRAAVDVLPAILASVLRGMSFPKQMHWDAWLEDGRGALPFGRPIRWILFLYGGRVVPFLIRRSSLAQSNHVHDVKSAAVTYGHRFLASSGRPGRAIKVRTFDEYRSRLAENFVLIDRGERHEKIARELDAHARRLGGRVSAAVAGQAELLQEVPDLVEYPSVIAGTFSPEFLRLPEEVLAKAMIHHQHFFPVTNDSGRLMPAFLSVINTQRDNARNISWNSERVLTARLRDARFFWESDRKVPLAGRAQALDTVQFHRKLGTYREKARRLEALSRWIAGSALAVPELADAAAEAGRLAKNDLVTDMVREFTDLQGTMGGIYAREDGAPEEVWRAIYHHYLPIGVEAEAPPTRQDLGAAAVTWTALSLADKLDTVTGLFAAGERPTGTRDPFGLRRLAQGLVRILADLPVLTGIDQALSLEPLVKQARAGFEGLEDTAQEEQSQLATFLVERLRFLLERRGFRYYEVNAVVQASAGLDVAPLDCLRRMEALRSMRSSADFEALGALFKRVKNIARELPAGAEAGGGTERLRQLLREPAESALLDEIERRRPAMERAIAARDYRTAVLEAAALRPAVDRFFQGIFVMVEDRELREARLRLMVELRDLVLRLADISEIVSAQS
jgi:glycyl-tRNA synthetase beta chain